MRRAHPNHDLPGPAALRGHREKGRAPFLVVERLLSRRSVQMHAAGSCAPRGAALVAYRVHLGIPVHAWFRPEELRAVGLDEQGKKISEGT